MALSSRPSQNTSGIFIPHACVDYKLNNITNFQVQNATMLLGLSGKSLQHIRIANGKQTHIKLPMDEMDRIAYIHLDYSAYHAIVSTVSGENFYLSLKTQNPSPKPLRKLKNMTISAVAWNLYENKDSETGFIVLGTIKGAILETNITSSGQVNYLKTLANSITGDKELAITQLYMHQCSEDEAERFILLISLPGRLYSLIGNVNLSTAVQQPAQQVVGTVWSSVMMEQQQSAVLQPLFNSKSKLRYHSVGAEHESPPSALVVHPISRDEPPTRFAWLSADGLSIGSIDVSATPGKGNGEEQISQTDGYDAVKVDFHKKHSRSEGRFDYPLDIALTEYHVLLIYTNRLVAINLLNRAIAFEDQFKTNSKLIGMVRDASSQLIWVFAESNILRYRPSDETRNVWRILLEQKEFAKARKITSQMSDQSPYQMVIKKEAEKFITEKNYVAAAELLAQSTEQFETCVLNFLRDGPVSRNGLKRFLELKLNQLGNSNSNEAKVRRDLLVLWLLEIQLSELAELRRSVKKDCSSNFAQTTDSFSRKDRSSTSSTGGILLARESEIKKLREELYCFLNRPIVFDSVGENQAAVYRMISSHVDFETQMYLALKLKDYDVVLKLMILQRQFKQVLEVMVAQAVPRHFYKYAPDLITEIPMELVDSLMKNERILKPVNLLSAFYKCFDSGAEKNPKMLAATFCYFDHVVASHLSSVDATVHDFVIHLYATFRPSALMDYLRKVSKKRRADGRLSFDAEQTLRICIDKNLRECCVFLYCLEERYEEAVKLALTFDLELAKQCAQELNRKCRGADEIDDEVAESSGTNPFLDEENAWQERRTEKRPKEETRKRVWLEISKSMIAKCDGHDVSACLALLDESDGAISIQDILSFFPEFTKIEHFKGPLCACLKEHSREIQKLHKEMREATEIAGELRVELERGKSNYMVIKSSDKCSKCRENLLARPFLAFACRHFFHRECLERHLITAEFSQVEKREFSKYSKEEKVLRKQFEMSETGTHVKAETAKRLNSVRERLKELLGDDCPFCGRRAIDAIDRPFFDDLEYRAQLDLWSFT